jgi:hypothetical protein
MTVTIRDNITKSLHKIEKSIESVPDAAYAYWRSITPVRTGTARRRTVLKNNTIEARYAYAAVLDSGSSRQAPDGMSKPTTDYLDGEYKKRVRK